MLQVHVARYLELGPTIFTVVLVLVINGDVEALVDAVTRSSTVLKLSVAVPLRARLYAAVPTASRSVPCDPMVERPRELTRFDKSHFDRSQLELLHLPMDLAV